MGQPATAAVIYGFRHAQSASVVAPAFVRVQAKNNVKKQAKKSKNRPKNEKQAKPATAAVIYGFRHAQSTSLVAPVTFELFGWGHSN